MNACVCCTARTQEQIEAIVAGLKRAGFASPHVSRLTDALMPPSPATNLDGASHPGRLRIWVQVANPNQRNAARDIFYQHDADDIETGNETHATAH